MKANPLKNNIRSKHRVHLLLFSILFLTTFIYLMGWPTNRGPYKPSRDYFLILFALTAFLYYETYKLRTETSAWFRQIVFSKIFLIYFGLIASLFCAEAVIRVSGLAMCGGGQGPLQPDFGLSGYKLNSLGFRGPEHQVVKYKNKIRIIGLGDSQVFGQGVEWQDTFLEQLKTTLDTTVKRTFETINFGKCGWNTINEQEFFLKEGVNYKPDILILLYTLNDPEFGGYFYKPIFSGAFEVRYLWRSHLYFFIVKLYNQLKYPYNEYIINLFKNGSETAKHCQLAMENIYTACKRIGIKPILVITPLLKDLKNYPFEEMHRKVRQWGEKDGFYVIDLLPEFSKYSRTGKEFRVSPEDWHPNKQGHKIIAEVIAREILDKRMYQ